MLALTPIYLSQTLRSPRIITAIVIGTASLAGVAAYVFTRRKPTAEEIERERRDVLARSGRITDGTIMDTMIMDTMVTEARREARSHSSNASEASAQGDDAIPPPQIIVYNYRIAGVTYECAQDVTGLADHVHGIRTDLPIQVRYSPRNPANSIVVAESWSGLRLSSSHPYRMD